MTKVNFKKDNDSLIRVHVEISGFVQWAYKYRAEENLRVSRTFDDDLSNDHTLGLGHELVNDRDVWRFDLLNASDKDQEYHITIKWSQDGNFVDDVWQIKDSLPAGKPESINGWTRLKFN